MNELWDRTEALKKPDGMLPSKIRYATAWTTKGCVDDEKKDDSVLKICPLPGNKIALNCWNREKVKPCRLQSMSRKGDKLPVCTLRNLIPTDGLSLYHLDCCSTTDSGKNPKRARAEQLGLWMEPECKRYGIPVGKGAPHNTDETFAQVYALPPQMDR